MSRDTLDLSTITYCIHSHIQRSQGFAHRQAILIPSSVVLRLPAAAFSANSSSQVFLSIFGRIHKNEKSRFALRIFSGFTFVSETV